MNTVLRILVSKPIDESLVTRRNIPVGISLLEHDSISVEDLGLGRVA